LPILPKTFAPIMERTHPLEAPAFSAADTHDKISGFQLGSRDERPLSNIRLQPA